MLMRSSSSRIFGELDFLTLTNKFSCRSLAMLRSLWMLQTSRDKRQRIYRAELFLSIQDVKFLQLTSLSIILYNINPPLSLKTTYNSCQYHPIYNVSTFITLGEHPREWSGQRRITITRNESYFSGRCISHKLILIRAFYFLPTETPSMHSVGALFSS